MSNIVEKLTENIVARDLSKEGAALVNKWEKTGLLEGLGDDRTKDNMSRLLENQAKELLREASTMAAGDVEGFAAVAFPIVRRVFGGLLANDLVSVQPMSLPSGLIFFLDFQKTDALLGDSANSSVYGGNAVGQQITGGVNLQGGNDAADPGSFYNLNNGYASAVSGGAINNVNTDGIPCRTVHSGAIDANGIYQGMSTGQLAFEWNITLAEARRVIRQDPDLTSGTGVVVFQLNATDADEGLRRLNRDNLQSITICEGDTAAECDTTFWSGSADHMGLRQQRRLTTYATSSDGTKNTNTVICVATITGTTNYQDEINTAMLQATSVAGHGEWLNVAVGVMYDAADPFTTGFGDPGSVVGTSGWLLESDTNNSFDSGSPIGDIAEIDIKVDSVAITAITKKLKAKWSPELGQDLNAYHNLDAEVELTGILSEQIALEIDREILEDLIKRATAGVLHWSRSPGLFVNRETGVEVGASSAAPDFTGTVSEWYETLLETINDVSARIHRKTLRGGANFIVTSPEVASILEFTAGFRASVSVDSNGTAGAMKTGSVSKKYDVYVDPYFPRNLCLVGRKGASFLESGYVYAPYVPLQVTPTIFNTEDFTPRKGVMTRYAKKMVRPDMYGVVVVQGLVGAAGATS